MTQTANNGILLAEDDRIDAKAFVRAAHRLGLTSSITVARDGIEAWELLDAEPPLRPELIVLDINMPRMSGLELLQKIRASAALRDTPVFMLTTSSAGTDHAQARELNVAAYILKSDMPGGLTRALQSALPARSEPLEVDPGQENRPTRGTQSAQWTQVGGPHDPVQHDAIILSNQIDDGPARIGKRGALGGQANPECIGVVRLAVAGTMVDKVVGHDFGQRSESTGIIHVIDQSESQGRVHGFTISPMPIRGIGGRRRDRGLAFGDGRVPTLVVRLDLHAGCSESSTEL